MMITNLLLPALGGQPMKLFPGLFGVTLPEKPVFTWSNLLHGEYQAAFARQVGTKQPFFPAAVRLRNQVEHAVFGVAAISALLEGPGPSLIEVNYTTEYCARDIAAFQRSAPQRAAEIRRMQDIQERRGKHFLYVLTPAKVAQYPDILPAGYTCPAKQADRAGIVPAWLADLQAAGVHVVDTSAVMFAAHGAYPFRMYPSSGAHWNEVGAALSMQAVFRGLAQLDPGGGFTPFTFTWAMRKHPIGLDVDIALLMNLFRSFPSPPVPAVTVQPGAPPTPCPATRVTVIGGSFGHAILEYIGRTTCLPSAVLYEYWHSFRVTWNGRALDARAAMTDQQRAVDILDADVLVLEENEQILPRPDPERTLAAFLDSAAVAR